MGLFLEFTEKNLIDEMDICYWSIRGVLCRKCFPNQILPENIEITENLLHSMVIPLQPPINHDLPFTRNFVDDKIASEYGLSSILFYKGYGYENNTTDPEKYCFCAISRFCKHPPGYIKNWEENLKIWKEVHRKMHDQETDLET